MARLRGQTSTDFEWSTSEQVWPFEKALDGSTLYCKQIDLGALPNAGLSDVSLGFTLDATKVFRCDCYGYDADGDTKWFPIPWAHANTVNYNTSYQLKSNIYGGEVRMYNPGINWSGHTGVFRIIYAK